VVVAEAAPVGRARDDELAGERQEQGPEEPGRLDVAELDDGDAPIGHQLRPHLGASHHEATAPGRGDQFGGLRALPRWSANR
jgi:hypothetical protein